MFNKMNKTIEKVIEKKDKIMKLLASKIDICIMQTEDKDFNYECEKDMECDDCIIEWAEKKIGGE